MLMSRIRYCFNGSDQPDLSMCDSPGQCPHQVSCVNDIACNDNKSTPLSQALCPPPCLVGTHLLMTASFSIYVAVNGFPLSLCLVLQ